MAAKIINGIRYVRLTHDNILKSLSFEDNLYHTLLDIWRNIEINDALRLSHYISQLSGDIEFKKRTEDFKYNDVLNDKDYVKNLYLILTNLCVYKNKLDKNSLFDFQEIEEVEYEDINMKLYMKYDDWWEQFVDLYYKLENTYKLQNNIFNETT